MRGTDVVMALYPRFAPRLSRPRVIFVVKGKKRTLIRSTRIDSTTAVELYVNIKEKECGCARGRKTKRMACDVDPLV